MFAAGSAGSVGCRPDPRGGSASRIDLLQLCPCKEANEAIIGGPKRKSRPVCVWQRQGRYGTLSTDPQPILTRRVDRYKCQLQSVRRESEMSTSQVTRVACLFRWKNR